MTGTSSQGLALMYEILPIASALRLPIIMCEVNRAISGPINIHCDHSDTMAARDFGWIQIYCENSQEAYDTTVAAVKIAEKMKLPTMVTTDGFIISHCMERLEILEDSKIKNFVGEYKAFSPLLDINNPTSRGLLDLQDYYFEHRLSVADAMRHAKEVILEVDNEYGKNFGRKYGLFEEYKLDDAERVIVAIGSMCGTAKAVVDDLRAKGEKVGLLRVRVFRPFPAEEIAKVLSKAKSVAVLDRVDSWSGKGAPLFVEIRSAMLDSAARPKFVNYVYGLGGRDIGISDIKSVYESLKKVEMLPEVNYLGVRE